MNYQKVMYPPSQFYSHQQVFYENPEYIDEAESFNDNVSYTESDGFVAFPMVRPVPSYDIQELYIRNPMVSSSQILSSPRRSRLHANRQRSELAYELKPRPPPHLKNQHRLNPTRCDSLKMPQSAISRSGDWNRNQPRPYTREKGITIMSNPTLPLGSKIATSKELRPGFRDSYQPRPLIRPGTPRPRRTMCSTSEPATNYQDRDPRAHLQRHIDSTKDALSEETTEPNQDYQQAKSCYPQVVECAGEVKKMNSEGDATGYANLDSLDGIGRIAATLDVEEAEKLSDNQKKEIKEMSKFLKPRIPSSLLSLQEKRTVNENDQSSAVGDKEDIEKSHITFRKSLDSILNQLESCESSLNAVRARFSMGKDSTATKKQPSKPELKGVAFNLQDITEKLGRAREEKSCEKEKRAEASDVPVIRSENTIEDASSGFESRGGSRGTILDDTFALDLHRSKSYIVNLIDRALSKELGTISNEMQGRFQDLSPIKAVRKIELNRKTVPCECGSGSSFLKEDEPSYIKQLKELRWGHFKHIQQEVQRLEDLERFLDHCGVTDS